MLFDTLLLLTIGFLSYWLYDGFLNIIIQALYRVSLQALVQTSIGLTILTTNIDIFKKKIYNKLPKSFSCKFKACLMNIETLTLEVCTKACKSPCCIIICM